jgi:hypothetical protein
MAFNLHQTTLQVQVLVASKFSNAATAWNQKASLGKHNGGEQIFQILLLLIGLVAFPFFEARPLSLSRLDLWVLLNSGIRCLSNVTSSV